MSSQDKNSHTNTKNLKKIINSVSSGGQIKLSAQEIDAIVAQLSHAMPASDVPGVVLSGMARFKGRNLSKADVDQDMALLFSGLRRELRERVTYMGAFAGPAMVIWAYQNLLKLSGKQPDDAFPNGTWQFYAEYALREDTARHANETHGFDNILESHDIHLSHVDRIAAWVMAAVHCLHQYDDLLENEWRERVYTSLLRTVTMDLPDAFRYARVYKAWWARLPYHRGSDVGFEETYPAYRRRKFDEFLQEAMRGLPAEWRESWKQQVEKAEREALPAYKSQMTILAHLVPGPYREERALIDLKQVHIGLIYQGGYYLLPVCKDREGAPIEVETVRAQVAAMLAAPAKGQPFQLTHLAGIRRAALADFLAAGENPALRKLELLQRVPILINCDKRDPNLPLSDLRHTERGIGSHSLTLIDTGKTMVFDQSHIFFDGAWGAALAEILTNEATSWGVYLYTLSRAKPAPRPPYALNVSLADEDVAAISKMPRVEVEAWAESARVNIKAILALRKLFKRRSDLIQLTVNDLLVLYHAIHAAQYQLSPALIARLRDFALHNAKDKMALKALQALKSSLATGKVSPSIMIPVDASQKSPRERVHPLSFEVPLANLNLLPLHQRVINALDAYKLGRANRHEVYAEFDRLQREYLTMLAGFGGVFNKAKKIAAEGKSASVGTIKLLAHMPPALQRMLDEVSVQFDVVNDFVKGREVFSNVGAVVPTSTLTRFLSAKDDNEKKSLVWGILTDAEGRMSITLRDFRPHVRVFISAGFQDIANQITQDYLDAFADGLNQFVHDLRRITVTSRETRLAVTGALKYIEVE